MTLDLPLIFAVLMGAAILAYVVLDGFDLGVGMLLPAAEEREQNRMVNSIGPFWDANETWLVLGIGILLVAFPVAHGVVLQALYLPVVAMLVGLMLRGVAFEFRLKAEGWHRELWNGSSGSARSSPHSRKASCSGATSPGSSRGSATFSLRSSSALRCAAATCCSARPG
jgi:cytochrome bd-type quinol oxidase subunit 2